MPLGELLTQLRQQRKLSQTHLAQAAGVSRMSVFRWENNRVLPREYELRALLDALAATPRERRQADALRASERDLAVDRTPAERRLPVHRGDLLRALRGRRGWTAAETARRAGITRNLLWRWENLSAWPDDARIHQIAYTLGASEAELLALSGGISALESLAPPSASEMYAALWRMELEPIPLAQREPLLFALAYRATSPSLEPSLSADLTATIGFLHAYLLMGDGRLREAHPRFQRTREGLSTALSPGTRLLGTQILSQLTRASMTGKARTTREEVGRCLWRNVETATPLEEKVSPIWRAALASERAFALAYQGDAAAALAEGDRALQLAARGERDDFLTRLPDRSRLLYELGLHDQLLDELPPFVGQRPDVDIFLNLYIGLAHQATGDAAPAYPRLLTARALAEKQFRPAARNLAVAALAQL